MKSETLITKTPVCRFQYTWLVEPDTKYDPLWKVTCLIDPNDALELEKELDGYLENWKKQLKTAFPDKKFKLASSNIPKISILNQKGINVKDLITFDKIFIEEKSINEITKRLS